MAESKEQKTKLGDVLNPKNRDEISITKWTEVFGKIYAEVDSKRSPLEVWVAATSYFSAVGEAIRRMNFADLMHAASHAFCWMCSFVLACQREKNTVFELKESFSDLVACKYPNVCKHCRQRFCTCNPETMDKLSNKAAHYHLLLADREKLGDAPNAYTVSLWLDIFRDIYGQQIHMLPLESIGFHFLEEAGEELTSIRNLVQLENVAAAGIEGINYAFLTRISTYKDLVELYEQYAGKKLEPSKRETEAIKARLVLAKIDMITEFADTFSWFCSILNKIRSIAQNCNEKDCSFTKNAFQEKVWNEYMPEGKPRCPTCKESPCQCVFFPKS